MNINDESKFNWCETKVEYYRYYDKNSLTDYKVIKLNTWLEQFTKWLPLFIKFITN